MQSGFCKKHILYCVKKIGEGAQLSVIYSVDSFEKMVNKYAISYKIVLKIVKN